MQMLLNEKNQKELLELISSGGIVIYNGYFLLGFSEDSYGKKGNWIDCSYTFQGENDYSDFIKHGEIIEVFCFEPVETPVT